MCLGVPGRITELDRTTATARVDVLGATREVSVLLVADEVAEGDWVVVHVGFAIGRVDEDEARRTLDLLGEALAAEARELAEAEAEERADG